MIGPPCARIHVVDDLQRARSFESGRSQIVIVVVALEIRVDTRGEERAPERIAALARNHIHLDTAERLLGRARRIADRDLLRGRHIRDEVTELTVAGGGADRHAVDHHALVVGPAAVDGQRVQIEVRRAAVVQRPVHPRDQIGEIVLTPPHGNRIEDLLVHRALLRHALDVDNRGSARHGHRFLQRSNAHVRIHSCGEGAGQLDAVPFEGVESR